MFAPCDRKLDQLARTQHGVFSRDQALGCGYTLWMIRTRLDRGHWLLLDPAVYALASHPPTWRYQCTAAVLSVPHGLVSGRAAAHLHGFDGFRPGPIHVVTPPRSNERSRLATVHRSPFVRREVVDGVPCLDRVHTILDLATFLYPDHLADVVDRVLTRRQVDFDDLVNGFLRHAAGRRHGTVALREILDARHPEAPQPPITELERLLRKTLEYPGLPPFEFEVTPPWWPDGAARVDACSAPCRMVIEADGRRWHTRERDFVKDRRRDNLAVENGYVVLRFTFDDLSRSVDQARSTVLRTALARGWSIP